MSIDASSTLAFAFALAGHGRRDAGGDRDRPAHGVLRPSGRLQADTGSRRRIWAGSRWSSACWPGTACWAPGWRIRLGRPRGRNGVARRRHRRRSRRPGHRPTPRGRARGCRAPVLRGRRLVTVRQRGRRPVAHRHLRGRGRQRLQPDGQPRWGGADGRARLRGGDRDLRDGQGRRRGRRAGRGPGRRLRGFPALTTSRGPRARIFLGDGGSMAIGEHPRGVD